VAIGDVGVGVGVVVVVGHGLWDMHTTNALGHAKHDQKRRLWNIHKLEEKGTGWRRLIGSPKLQIIFHKRAIKYRSLLRKMTYKDKGSYESSPPCTVCTCHERQIYLSTETDINMYIFIFCTV